MSCFVGELTERILSPEEWYPEFHRFHVEVVRSTPDLDWGWLKRDRPELYHAIKAIEDTIDGLGDARLSDVLNLMREWRDLILKAESERKGTHEQDHKEAKVSDLRGKA